MSRLENLIDMFFKRRRLSEEVKEDFKHFCEEYEDCVDETVTDEDIEFWWKEYNEQKKFIK